MKRRRFLGTLAGAAAGLIVRTGSAGGTDPEQLLDEHTQRPYQGIVIADAPSGSAELAAQELQSYLRRMRYHPLGILKESAAIGNGPFILIGPSGRVPSAILRQVEELPPEWFIARSTDIGLVIAGKDNPALTRDHFAAKSDRRLVYQAAGTAAGTLFGTYWFLREHLSVDWFFAGVLGETLPERKQSSIPKVDAKVGPDYQFREIYLIPEGVAELAWPQAADTIEIEWRRRHTYRAGLGTAWGLQIGHSMMYWIDAFGESHPEYFALVDGQRQNKWHSARGAGVDFCWGRPSMIEQQLREVETFRANQIQRDFSWYYADRNCFPIVALDGVRRLCEDEFCRPHLEKGRHWRGAGSSLYAFHLNRVARTIKDRYPGMRLSALAYGPRALPPTSIRLDDNVIMNLAFGVPRWWYNESVYALYNKTVEKWREVAQLGVLWSYVIHNEGPIVATRAVAREIKTRKGQVMGFFLEAGSNSLQWLDHYVASRLMWDTTLDVEALVNQFCDRLFGSGATAIKQFFRLLEDTWAKEARSYALQTEERLDLYGEVMDKLKGYPGERLYQVVYTPKVMIEASRLLADASKAAVGDVAIQKRVELIRKEFGLYLQKCLLANRPVP
jgi:hypothetical protein